jgi:hypothetical protein
MVLFARQKEWKNRKEMYATQKVGVCKVMKDKVMESELHDMDER